MSDRRRSEFVQRLSAAGWNALESVQLLLSSVAFDLRDLSKHGAFAEQDRSAVEGFRREAESLWHATIHVDPPIDPVILRTRVEELRVRCQGPLARFRGRMERAERKARELVTTMEDS